MEKIGLLAILASVFVLSDGQTLEISPFGDTHSRALDSSILFTCKSVGMDTAEVDTQLRWFNQDGQEITDTSGRKYIENVGPQELKLYITKIENVDAGDYSCTGIMEGAQQEAKVKLLIFKDITFDNAPSPQHPAIHTLALIECEVSGQPVPEVTWKYQGSTIITGGRYAVQDKGLNIANITEDDNGMYICRAEVAAQGRYEQENIMVEVHIPPTITNPPAEDLEGIEGHELSIVCTGDGKPKPKYVFFKDDNVAPIQDTADERITVNDVTGEVAFRPLVKADEGTYRCRAENTVGFDEASSELFVVVPPKITELINVTATEGDTSTLRCVVNADPAADMSFRKAGNEEDYVLGENDGGRIIVSSDVKNVLELEISELVPTDTSNYTCSATNRAGDDEKTGSVIVQYSPRFQEDHEDKVYSWAGKVRNMTCGVYGYPEPYIRWMRFDSELKDNETYRIYRMGRTCNLQVTIREQDQDWIYGDYTCHASSSIPPDAETSVELIRATYPDPPDKVEVIDKLSTPTMVVMNVTAPSEDGGQPLLGYEVTWETMSQTFDLDLTSSTKNDVVKIMNLRGETNYIFYIKSFNEVGRSEAYELAHTTANIREPYPIRITSENVGLYPNKYTVTWAEPQDGGMLIKYYDISWRKVSVKDGTFELDEPIEDWTRIRINDDESQPMRWYKIVGLNSNSYYEIEIIATNDRGSSSPNNEFIFVTHKGGKADQSESSETKGGKEGMAAINAGGISTAAVIGIVIAVFFIFLVIVDICCYFVNDCGVLSIICGRSQCGAAGKPSEKAMEEGESKEIVMEQQPMAEEEKVPPEEGEEVQPEEDPIPANDDEECLSQNRKSAALSEGNERWRDVVEELERELSEKKPLSELDDEAFQEDGKEPIDEKEELKRDEMIDDDVDEKTPLNTEEKC